MGLPEAKGALVASINDNSPASKGGLKPGDVILKFDGKDVNEMRKLPRVVAETPINKTVPVEIWRDGKRQTVNVNVGEMEDEPAEPAAKAPEKPQADQGGQAIPGTGLSVATLSPQLREKFGIDEETKGVVIVDVKDGPAAEKGLKAGDVITEAGHKPVRNPADLTKLIDQARSGGQKFLLLRVETTQAPRYVALTLAEAKGKK
jgi:serine protease Do